MSRVVKTCLEELSKHAVGFAAHCPVDCVVEVGAEAGEHSDAPHKVTRRCVLHGAQLELLKLGENHGV